MGSEVTRAKTKVISKEMGGKGTEVGLWLGILIDVTATDTVT